MIFLHWLLAHMEANYQEAYWESVAKNEQWLKMLMELTDEKK